MENFAWEKAENCTTTSIFGDNSPTEKSPFAAPEREGKKNHVAESGGFGEKGQFAVTGQRAHKAVLTSYCAGGKDGAKK